VQHREELRQIGHNRGREMGKISFWKGGGINVIIGTIYRPLHKPPVGLLFSMFVRGSIGCERKQLHIQDCYFYDDKLSDLSLSFSTLGGLV
jgi:hypothetical protein